MSRRFQPPWRVELVPGGFKVLDADGQALVYIYARETEHQASIAGMLTFDEARRISMNVTRLPKLLTLVREPLKIPIVVQSVLYARTWR